ncbi:putative Ubiquitin carboxyl-terminal hydrolase 18 [Nannochloris sp. 'desiccata']|nr:putative Ubiquitin carboxyl-terminal hydrolase 18 [Chlorella desiccata (nom. nud.)]
MAPELWWKKPYQPPSAEAVTALLKDCAICGNHALHRCKNCAGVGYCGRACQIKHWPEHKKECAALKARTLAALTPKTNTNGAAAVCSTSSSSAAPAAPANPQSNAAIPIATMELYPYDKFIQNWNSISLSNRVPCGIFNLGNTCYINAILQIFLATRPFAAYLLTNEHTCPSPAADLYRNAKTQWCPLCCLVSLAQEVFETSPQPRAADGGGGSNGSYSRNPLSIRYFTHFVHHLNSSFTFGDQHDAQELYVALLDAIECVFLRENEAKIKGGAATIKKLDQFSKQTTLMNHVFTCYTRTQVECTKCGKVSKSYATDTGIMLSVPEGKLKKAPHTLENLLENFTAVEILEGDDAYRCDACCARVKARKSNVIEIAPNILAIQLSRVGMNFFGAGEEAPQKNSAAVEFPLELDLTPFMALDALDAAPTVYELYAVVTHEGSTTEDGHYISVVRYGGGGGGGRNCSSTNSSDSQNGQWYVCDDDVVSPLSADIVLKQQEDAYLLFYERKHPRMPQLLSGGGGVGGDATAMTNGAIADIVEKSAATQEAIEEVKPRNATEEEEEEEESQENFVSYVFEIEKNDSGARVLWLKVRLPTFDDDDSAAVPQLDLKNGKPVFAEVSCGGCHLRLPLPVQVELPARKIVWNRDEKILVILFDAL